MILEQHFPFWSQGFSSNVAEFLCLDPILQHCQEVLSSAFVCVFPPNSACECFFSRETAVHKSARMTVVVCVAGRWGGVVVAAAGSSRVSVLNCPALPR